MEADQLTRLILALAVVTFAFRFVPLAWLTGRALPPSVEDWLGLVPGAVLAASLALDLVPAGNTSTISLVGPRLLAALPAFAVAWRTRSMLLTMASGMACYALLERLLG